MGVYFSREIPNQLIFGIFSFFQGVFGGRPILIHIHYIILLYILFILYICILYNIYIDTHTHTHAQCRPFVCSASFTRNVARKHPFVPSPPSGYVPLVIFSASPFVRFPWIADGDVSHAVSDVGVFFIILPCQRFGVLMISACCGHLTQAVTGVTFALQGHD